MSGMMPGMSMMMMQQPQMGGMMPGYYNMPGMMPRYYNMPGMMTNQMQQMPQMQQVPEMMPQMQPGGVMPRLQQGTTAVAGGSRQGVPQPHGDNAYRPYMDLLSNDSPIRTLLKTRTALETQFPDSELFSFDDLGISPRNTPATQLAAPPVRTRRPMKSKATTSRAATDSGAEEVGGRRKRTIWKIEECVALAKAWISVVDDPYVSANQVIDRMWYRISQSYLE